MDLGNRVKQLRVKSGLTLEELASRTELTKGFLSQLERNLASPSIATLEDIVRVLGVSLADGREPRIHGRRRSRPASERRGLARPAVASKLR